MPERPTYSFGEPNWETVGRWLHLDPADDGPVWMLNLMQYRQVAAYADGRETRVSGREADDAYAPLGPLAAVGAAPVLYAEVTAQLAGEPSWDRVAVVRYPTRAAFFAMQERDDYKEKFVHKEAGMAFTIVMGCVPGPDAVASAPATAGEGDLLLRVRRFVEGVRPATSEEGAVPVVRLEVDGVVLGDERTWDEVRLDRVTDGQVVLGRLLQEPGVADQIAVVVEPALDRIVESLVAPGRPA